jgi:hypothetical protein
MSCNALAGLIPLLAATSASADVKEILSESLSTKRAMSDAGLFARRIPSCRR